jgi:4-hydroxythreonine-4-phosphate dehydrogenase
MTTNIFNNSIAKQPVIAITMGDPAGIGPEIVVKALADPEIRKAAKYIIFGLEEQLEYAADKAEIEPFWYRCQHEKFTADIPAKVLVADYDEYSVPPSVNGPNKTSGHASLEFCIDATHAAIDGLVDAVVTAPISKISWKLAGAKWPGHTELLATLCKSRKIMMFAAGPLKVALATIHQALFDVRHNFTIGAVFEPIDLLNTALIDYFDIPNPKIAIAGLNPHAGEDGRFGDEEKRIITPAINLARQVGINCHGPYPADTVFLRASRGEFDGVIAMYHDQAMIPVKLLAFENAVNITIGLPIIRTSPAHGTAFDIAQKNLANPTSMISAIKTAIQMANSRKKLHLSTKNKAK